jgi:hypothetical protein
MCCLCDSDSYCLLSCYLCDGGSYCLLSCYLCDSGSCCLLSCCILLPGPPPCVTLLPTLTSSPTSWTVASSAHLSPLSYHATKTPGFLFTPRYQISQFQIRNISLSHSTAPVAPLEISKAFFVHTSSTPDHAFMMAPSTNMSLYAKLESWVVSATGTRVQAEVAWRIAPKVPHFIVAAEKATFDCGLLLTEKIMTCPPTERVFEIAADSKLKGKSVVIPLDVKHIGPVLCRTIYGGYYDYRITCQQSQRETVAFIVKNPAADDLAAVIPHWYLDRTWPKAHDTKTKSRPWYGSLDIPIIGDSFEPFPPEWGPFVLPETYLPQAMESLTQFALGKAEW